MIAVIAGATGLVGSHLVRHLLRDPAVSQVIVVGRRSIKLAHDKLQEILVTNLSDLESRTAKLKGDTYFSCLGTTIKAAGGQVQFRAVDYTGNIDFAKVAASHQARVFVLVSAYGADRKSWVFYSRTKGETEDAVRALELRSFAILRPSLLVGERVEKRFAEEVAIRVARLLGPLLPERIKKLMMTDVDHLALRMIEIAKKGEVGTQVFNPRQI